jgi:membrane protease YdiL (CAAX protease family)
VTNLFFAAIHFVKPTERIAIADVTGWSGLRHLASSFSPLLEPVAVLPGLVGLFLIGAALSYALFWTNSLYLSIGLHAGWIFSLKSIRIYGDFRREDLGWVFGTSEPKLVSGVATWIGIILVGVTLHFITRNRRHVLKNPA